LDLYTKIDPMVQPVRDPSAAPTEGIVPAPAATA